MLGTHSGHEIRVSRAFAACFAASPPFRNSVLQLLFTTCRLGRCGSGADWTCDAEITVSPTERIDLQVQSPNGGPVFQLESKVSARLTEGQMRRYRRLAGDKYLIAITKSPPETGVRWLRQSGCYALRWQDVHRALKAGRGLRGSDRFLAEAFCEYLEEFGMAHREDVSLDQLQNLGRVFRTISGKGDFGIAVRDAFEVAASCMALLQDVCRDSADAQPRLARESLWGPNYYRHVDDKGVYHTLVFRWHDKSPSWTKWWFGGALSFPQDEAGELGWEIEGDLRGVHKRKHYTIQSVLNSDRMLDRTKMAKTVLQGARQFQLIR